MKPAKRLSDLKSSVGFELLKIGQKLKAEGEDVVSLAIGQLRGNTYKPLISQAKKALEEGYTKYTPAEGTESLRKKIAERASRQFDLKFATDNICVGSGCKSILFGIFQAFCNPEDEVLLPTPYWMSYPPLIQTSGAKIQILPTKEEKGFKVTPEELEVGITKKTKFFLLNSPNNPTSAVYSEEELKALGEVLKSFPSVYVVYDAIYDLIVFSGGKAPHLLSVCPDLKDRILVVNGASKSHLMTGWRLGWLIANKAIVKTLSAFQSQSLGCPNSIAQKAFEEGVDLCEEDLTKLIKDLKSIRDLLVEGLKNISGLKLFPSEGAFYLWVGVQSFFGKTYKGQSINSSKGIMEQLLMDKKLLCICGEEFGLPGYLRLSYVAEKKDIQKAIDRLQDFFSKLT